MTSPNTPHSFHGTLEQCVEQYGGKSRFILTGPLTFFSGARLETHRRAQSHDGSVLIVETQIEPTSCEVYVRAGAIPAQSARSENLLRSNVA